MLVVMLLLLLLLMGRGRRGLFVDEADGLSDGDGAALPATLAALPRVLRIL